MRQWNHPEPSGSILFPNIGDIRRGSEVGYKSSNALIFQSCEDCGTNRWVPFKNGVAIGHYCIKCRMKHKKLKYPVLVENITIPKIGDIAYKSYIGGNLYRFSECPNCKCQRWIQQHKTKNYSTSLCPACKNLINKGSNHPSWKGGRIEKDYIFIWTSPDDFFYSMAGKKGYIAEHRLVMAKSLGRCLQKYEIVHHKNGNKYDNRIENLELTMPNAHSIAHSKGYKHGYYKGLIDGRNQQIEELKQEIRLLQLQVKEKV